MKLRIAIIVVILALFKFFSHKNETFEPKSTQYSPEAQVLALNIYHEARGIRTPGELGWRSVTAVVFNRLEDKRFPKTIHDIVYTVNKEKRKCQFSWVCDNLPDEPRDKKLYQKILAEAKKYLDEYREGRWRDITFGSHSYHAKSIQPNAYFQKLVPTVSVQTPTQGHIFYRDDV